MIGQVAKLLAARAEVRLTRALGSGTVRQGKCRRERGVEVTVREQQGRRMKHENGEGEMEKYDMRTANTLSHACSCLYVTQGKSAKKMCVRHRVCVHTRRTHRSCHYVGATSGVKKNLQTSSFHSHLDVSHEDVVHQFAFHEDVVHQFAFHWSS